MKRKLIMNLQLFGLGGLRGPMLEADTGAGAGTSGETGTGAETGATEPSFDDVLKDKKHQSEFDKRLAKALETAKGKWDVDYQIQIEAAKTESEKLAKMTADQKAAYEKDKTIDELTKREKDITTRELKATAKSTLADKGLPLELHEVLNYQDADTCSKSIESVARAFQSSVEKAVNEKLRGGGAPKGGSAGVDSGFAFNFAGVRPKK
ncbi:DUF4355 domain-containing protein [Clostridium gasigenes]|uniref:DUF4355 domain-containing protein n=1 Tax=Clostridium gasigenes TaxID=94869 RepID=A0A7X0SF20_9CLOT|nr:DUF4355 domain-containing protein [Clostridium gasigenes]MBB6716359.1 DUF4355 domain-containing protein [Clostridium gasigenes]